MFCNTPRTVWKSSIFMLHRKKKRRAYFYFCDDKKNQNNHWFFMIILYWIEPIYSQKCKCLCLIYIRRARCGILNKCTSRLIYFIELVRWLNWVTFFRASTWLLRLKLQLTIIQLRIMICRAQLNLIKFNLFIVTWFHYIEVFFSWFFFISNHLIFLSIY